MKILLFILLDSMFWVIFTILIHLTLVMFNYFFSGELTLAHPGNLIAAMIISLIPSTVITYLSSVESGKK